MILSDRLLNLTKSGFALSPKVISNSYSESAFSVRLLIIFLFYSMNFV